ncbi:MAG: hypothetical protein QOJ64_3062 [Acidobacteriota bacterium]|jgi:hypothetical protein|nr:hypothetical protein [Acidobacteriota bacterium]
MTFDDLLKKWDWKPIRNCPGRYVLQASRNDLCLADVLDADVDQNEYRVSTAPDAVLVVKLDEGGIISYKRRDGSFVHTLNTRDGFVRKLSQLGIIP